MLYQVTDWDDAYANSIHIANADLLIQGFADASAAFRAAHPPQPLGSGSLYLPSAPAKGLAMFIHGGFWHEPYPDIWSHLAAGAFAHDWAVAVPTYRLAPDATIAGMVAEIAAAITYAARHVEGPIALSGHSAGGQLAARMVCADGTLPDEIYQRVISCVPISGLADLRPLLRTKMNDVLQLDDAEARSQSPAFLTPRTQVPVTCWVGGAERPEFLRQSALLANIWAGMGVQTECVIEPGRNHFDILNGMTQPDSPLTRTLLGLNR